MSRKQIPLAIAYDFDGTLAPGNMQEYDFVPKIGMKKKDFWKEVHDLAKDHNGDNILMYMMHMLDKANSAKVSVRKSDIKEFGRSIKLFEGVKSWFGRINKYGGKRGVKVQHYIISSGLREMIEGTVIGGEFAAIYASSFVYDHNGVAKWPALAVNYTTKTQFLFRINKGVFDAHDNSKINDFVPMGERPVPFENIVFVGDGDTDVPCFRLVKSLNGHAIAAYKPNTKGAKTKAKKLVDEGRANYMSPADYRKDSSMEEIVKKIIDKIVADATLSQVTKTD
jgi:hypothetical protein